MADSITGWGSNHGYGMVDPHEKLFLFGYSSKIYPYDEKALFIDQGKHLIPWMGDESLMIDRYDVRGYLHDLQQYEARPDANANEPDEEEQLCNEERYRSLRTDVSEEQLYQEEEYKRLRAALAIDGAYHEINFSYDNTDTESSHAVTHKVEDPEDDLYHTPEGLNVPDGIEVPYTMKIHAIVERTAAFVADQGGQMEIIIRMKQQANPQFAFMHLDDPLHPYYKLLLREIKSGAYKPTPARKVSCSEDDDDDGHYLHPSLMAGKAENVPKFTVPTINFRRTNDDSYSVLVRNLKHHVEEKIQEEPEQTGHSESIEQFLVPPPSMKPVIDKMAEYVAKNGEDFETIVKAKKDKRFDFLRSTNEYYKYYIYQRNCARARNESNTPPPQITNLQSSNSVAENNQVVTYSSPARTTQPTSLVNYPSNDAPSTVQEELSQDSLDSIYRHSTPNEDSKPEPTAQESSDSMEFLNSPDSRESVKKKQTKVPMGPVIATDSMEFSDSPDSEDSAKDVQKKKVVKGPISFSLKAKEAEAPAEKMHISPFLGGDTDEEEESNNGQTGSKSDAQTSKNHVEKTDAKPVVEEKEAKVKQSTEFSEAKMAEERIRDKLLSTARERLLLHRREKQQQEEARLREEQERKERPLQLLRQQQERELQLERKKKAALFLQMLKGKQSDAVVSHVIGTEKPSKGKGKRMAIWKTADRSNYFPGGNSSSVIPGIRNDWSEDSASEKSGPEEPISAIGASSSESEKEAVVQKEKKKHKKKDRSRSNSKEKSHKKSKKSKKSKKEPSESPVKRKKREREKEKKKEKKLPAAYAMPTRERSRSRSPKRHKPPSHNYDYNYNYWPRRR